MRNLSLALALLLAVACSDSTGPESMSLAGTWTVTNLTSPNPASFTIVAKDSALSEADRADWLEAGVEVHAIASSAECILMRTRSVSTNDLWLSVECENGFFAEGDYDELPKRVETFTASGPGGTYSVTRQ